MPLLQTSATLCVCVCAGAALRLQQKEAAEIPEPLAARATQKFHSEATPARCAGTGHNPPSSCYQKGLNRTMPVTELFGDSSTMRPKQVGNKRDEESLFFFHSTPLRSITIVTEKKGLLLPGS